MSRSISARAATAVAILLLSVSHGQSQDNDQFDGKAIFRFDTFGDEQLWTNVLQMQNVISTVSPATALAVGLKVDSDALPPAVVAAIKAGQVNLNDPATTIALLKLNAVVGVIGKVAPDNTLTSIGVTCALCHSTVDNSFTPGIGHRLDGWPNRDLNVGLIISLSPAIPAPGLGSPDKSVFQSWGPGKFDARLHFFDGTTFHPLFSPTDPAVIAPAFGLKGVGFETFTGDGVVAYWNNYVGVTQMGGHGSFSDPRIGVTVTQTPDLVTPKLPALVKYELSLQAPPPPKGSFDKEAAERGKKLFNGAAGCARCHQGQLFTDVLSGPNPNVPFLHSALEEGQDPVYASRSATKLYRTTPLHGAWQHPPYFHDGSAPDLLAVVNHYNTQFQLNLADQQKADLVQYLKSL